MSALTVRIETGSGSGRQMLVRAGQQLTVGQTADADFRVNDPTLQPIHCRFLCEPATCLVESLSETELVQVNGESGDEPAILYDGDQVRLGNTTLSVSIPGRRRPVSEEDTRFTDQMPHLPFDTVADAIAGHPNLASLPVADPTLTPRQFLGELVETQQFEEALRFLSATLPAREVIWWGYRCVGEDAEVSDSDIFPCVNKWLHHPTEETRREAEAIAMPLDLQSPEACLAMAVFWSGGSLAPPDLPEAPPPPGLAGKAVYGGLKWIESARPDDVPKLQSQWVTLGISVAEGGDRWPEAPPA